MKKIAVYAGSFDPYTYGHKYVYDQAMELFDEVIILVAMNPMKPPPSDLQARINRIAKMSPGATITYWNNLVADYCKTNNIKHLIRGIRNTSDYLYEEEIAKVNSEINPELKTIYFRAKDEVISSSMVRLLYSQGRDVSKYTIM